MFCFEDALKQEDKALTRTRWKLNQPAQTRLWKKTCWFCFTASLSRVYTKSSKLLSWTHCQQGHTVWSALYLMCNSHERWEGLFGWFAFKYMFKKLIHYQNASTNALFFFQALWAFHDQTQGSRILNSKQQRNTVDWKHYDRSGCSFITFQLPWNNLPLLHREIFQPSFKYFVLPIWIAIYNLWTHLQNFFSHRSLSFPLCF